MERGKKSKCKYPLGIPMMEVFNIIYLGKDDIKPQEQLGTIKLCSACGVSYLYRVEEIDPCKPSIKYGDPIVLNVKAPTFTHEGDYVHMEFDLFCGAYKGSVPIEWEPRQSEVSLSFVESNSSDYTGRILVNIGLFGSATIASLEVKLVDNSAPTNVSGVIFASNSILNSSDSTSLLFHEKLHNGVQVGHYGVIPLSRSVVGVPLHSELYVEFFLNIDGVQHTATLSFLAQHTGPAKKSTTTDKEARILVNVTWGDYEHWSSISPLHDELSVNQPDLFFGEYEPQRTLSAVCSEFEAKDENFHWNWELTANKIWINKMIGYRLSDDAVNMLYKVTSCSRKDFLSPTSQMYFTAEFVKLHPVTLFNLIQAAHRFQLKSLMDLTCQTLVDKVKTKTCEEIMDEFYIPIAEPVRSGYSGEDIVPPRGLKDSIKYPGRMNVDSLLRQRGKETFINRSHLVDEPISFFRTKRQHLVKERNSIFGLCVEDVVESMVANPRGSKNLFEAFRWLNNFTAGDPGFADFARAVDVESLLQIVREIDKGEDREDDVVTIQSQRLAVCILSRAIARESFHQYWDEAVPALVKLMSDPLMGFNVLGLIALTRLAYACPTCTPLILKNGALEKAQEIANKSNLSTKRDVIHCVAKFLAVICYANCPRDKVEVALAISKNLFKKDILSTNHHVVSACYALQYLTYERPVEVGEVWNKIIRRLIGVICNCFIIENPAGACSAPEVAGSVLGVVGNIARWGHPDQIKILTEDSQFLRCLGKILCSEFKKFSKEACQIISNIAARRETWIQDMQEANLIKPLCGLLETDTDVYKSDVKMEAAWAIFNGIYGNNYRPIDKYPREMTLSKIP